MGVITDVKINKAGTRAKIYIDYEYCADVSVDIAYKYDLKIGAETDADKLEEIIFESEKIICTEYLIQYLCKYPCSEKKAAQKLKDKGFSPKSIQNSLASAKEYGYIDDYEYAKRYAESKISSYGTYKIKSELYRLGIDGGVVSEVLSEIDGEEVTEGAITLARKWWRTRDINDRNDKNKFGNYMSAKGYDWSVIGKCLDAVKRDEKDETDDYE